MKDNVHYLPLHDRMSAEQAIATALRAGMKDVVIIGRTVNGIVEFRSSEMKNQEALYLIKLAELHILGIK